MFGAGPAGARKRYGLKEDEARWVGILTCGSTSCVRAFPRLPRSSGFTRLRSFRSGGWFPSSGRRLPANSGDTVWDSHPLPWSRRADVGCLDDYSMSRSREAPSVREGAERRNERLGVGPQRTNREVASVASALSVVDKRWGWGPSELINR